MAPIRADTPLKTFAGKKDLKSTEFVVDSDDEEEAENLESLDSHDEPEDTAPVRPKVIAVAPITDRAKARRTGDGSSAASGKDDRDDDNDEESEQQADESRQTLDESEESVVDNEQSEDEEVENTEHRHQNKAPARASSPRRRVERTEPITDSQEPPSVKPRTHTPWTPPEGFELNPVKDNPKPVASQIFSKSKLEGKEIWYITAPASTPISAIQKLSLSNAKKGKPIFAHDGIRYSSLEDPVPDKEHLRLILPNASIEGYQISSKLIDHVIHVQQSIDLSVPERPGAVVSDTRVARKQPPGLKMRFHPFGFDKKTFASPDVTSKRLALESVSEPPRKKIKKSEVGRNKALARLARDKQRNKLKGTEKERRPMSG